MVAESHECPLHSWLWDLLEAEPFAQLLVEVTLPHLVCALRHGNSSVPKEGLLLRGLVQPKPLDL